MARTLMESDSSVSISTPVNGARKFIIGFFSTSLQDINRINSRNSQTLRILLKIYANIKTNMSFTSMILQNILIKNHSKTIGTEIVTL
jgi:hypothetical protein